MGFTTVWHKIITYEKFSEICIQGKTKGQQLKGNN